VFFAGVTAASVVFANERLGFSKALDLLPGPGGQAKVHISNMCDQNPLEWQPVVAPPPDDDVRWYYELLDHRTKNAIKKRIGRGGLPIPVPVSVGGGPDCSPHYLGKGKFDDLDKADLKGETK